MNSGCGFPLFVARSTTAIEFTFTSWVSQMFRIVTVRLALLHQWLVTGSKPTTPKSSGFGRIRRQPDKLLPDRLTLWCCRDLLEIVKATEPAKFACWVVGANRTCTSSDPLPGMITLVEAPAG